MQFAKSRHAVHLPLYTGWLLGLFAARLKIYGDWSSHQSDAIFQYASSSAARFFHISSPQIPLTIHISLQRI
jgi:hypothetical protein